jgi:hypothetical protein
MSLIEAKSTEPQQDLLSQVGNIMPQQPSGHIVPSLADFLMNIMGYGEKFMGKPAPQDQTETNVQLDQVGSPRNLWRGLNDHLEKITPAGPLFSMPFSGVGNRQYWKEFIEKANPEQIYNPLNFS